ncbi:MAG: hypothetical protein ACYC7L_06060 [Nitrospirota bacterium]
MKRIPLSLMLLVLVLAALPAFAADKRTTVSIGNSPSLGPENAPVTIIEFIDFQ